MEINSDRIKSLRAANGWTQQHLADVCNVSVRTVQRVERHGAASKETALSLCAVFELTIEDIIQHQDDPKPEQMENTISIYALVPVFIVGGVVGALLMKLWN